MDTPKGKDQFKDNRFSFKEWSAEILKTTDDALTRLKELDLISHKITDIEVVGGYNSFFSERNFSNFVCDLADKMSYAERKGINPYVWHDPNVLCQQEICVHDPIIITLDNGNRIELATIPYVGLRISKNCIPQGIHSTCSPNFNCRYLFSNFIGKTIADFEVHIPEDETIHEEGNSWVWDAYYRFICEDRTKLECSNSGNYTYLQALDASNSPIKIPLWKFEKSAIPELEFDNYRIGGLNEDFLSENVWKIIDSLEYPAKPYPTLEEKAELIQLAQSGDAEAQFQLGYLYFGEAEIHGAVMYDWAYEWLFKAANQNHPKALFKLAYLYDCGPKEWRNLEKAIEMYDRASKCGHENAADYLEMMDNQELVKKVLGENYNKKP